MPNQPNLLKSKRFLPLFLTQFLGAFNDNIFKNAFMVWFTYDVATRLNMNAQQMVTITSGLFVLPFFLFSAFAGQIADKFEKSKIIRIVKIAEILIMLFSFVGFYSENIYLLLLLTFLMGTHSTFFGPIKYSLLPETLKNHELVSGNALIEGGTFLAILLGTIFGGILIRSQNGIEIVCIALVFVAGLGYFASCFIPKTPINDPQLKINFNFFSQNLEIIGHARENRIVWLSIIGISWFWFIGITLLSQFPIYTKNIINGDEFVITLFFAVFSIGIGAGSVMCNTFLRGKISGKIVPLASFSASLGIFLFCATSSFYQTSENLIGIREFFFHSYQSYLIILSLLIISISSGIYIVPLYAIMQHHSNHKYLSRIIAGNNVLNSLFMVAASLIIVALINAKITLLQIFFTIGICNLFVFFFIRKIVKHTSDKKA